MIDWEEVIKAESTEELKEIKLWLLEFHRRSGNRLNALFSFRV